MKYEIQTPEGQKFSSEALEDIASALHNGTIAPDSWAWHEGLPEWVPVTALFPPPPGTNKKPEEITKDLAGKAASMLAKAGVGFAGFAAKSYRKATLQNRFSKALAAMLDDGKLDDSELEALRQMVSEAGGKWEDVIADCRPVAASFIRHQLADAIADEEVTKDEEQEIANSIRLFGLEEMKREVSTTIRRVRLLAGLRVNRIPRPLTDSPLWLHSGEAVHAKQKAELHNNGSMVSSGELWLTPTRLEYVTLKKGASIALKNIRDLDFGGSWLGITDVRGSRNFRVPDAEVMAAFIRCLLRASNRTATIEIEDSKQDRRRISKEVRNAVWIRDGRACVECGAGDYLEFDHLIPVAKGGGNTVNNIQLLCRRCNGKKSDRI